jgi:hypothetical protein
MARPVETSGSTLLILARQRLASEADNLKVGMANIWEP